MPVEPLPEDNGFWSTWRDVPAGNREHWLKPGFLKHVPDRNYGGSYDPFRIMHQDPPMAGYTGTNYFRFHNYASPDNHVYRLDHYNDREGVGAIPTPYANAYTLKPNPWGGRRTGTSPNYTISQVDETFSTTWHPLDTTVGASGSGPGMGPVWLQSEEAESYYRHQNILTPVLPSSFYFKAQPNYTQMVYNGTVGRDSSHQYTLTFLNTFGNVGLTCLLPFTEYADGSWSAGWVPSHTYRLSAWVKGNVGTIPSVGASWTIKSPGGFGTQVKYGNRVTVSPGDDWQYIWVEIRGEQLYNNIYSSISGSANWGTTTNPAGLMGSSFLLCDPRLEDMTQDATTVLTVTPDPFCAIRQDSSSAHVECFQRLYDEYGVWGGGEGHPPRTFERVRDATSWSTSRSVNQYFRSYGGQKDPRLLTNPMSASFGYSRWMETHPFCIWYYWTLNASTSMSVGNSYHSWGEGEDMRNWEMLLPSDVDPDFPLDLPYTWHRKNYPPATNYNWNTTIGGAGPGVWRPVQFDGDVEVVDSKFEIEVCGWGYNNTSGSAPCVSNTPAPPIPAEEFYLYVVEGNSSNYSANWPGMNGVPGDLLLTITPVWSGAQNGSWTLTGVTFSGDVASTYTLNTASDLGMGVSQDLYGCIPTIKPEDFASKKVTFFLVEKYARETSVPWFITEYDPELNRGNWTQTSSGFGTTHDLTTNSYSNSLTVGIQPLIKYRLPAKWRYAIPWGESVEEDFVPPLRMNQRDDGIGGFSGHSRITGATGSSYSSANGARIPGLNGTYR